MTLNKESKEASVKEEEEEEEVLVDVVEVEEALLSLVFMMTLN